MTHEKVMEQVRKEFRFQICGGINGDITNCEKEYCKDCSFKMPNLEEVLDKLFSIPEILIKDPDQSLPATYFANRKKMPWITDYDVEVCAQQDMLKEHWVKMLEEK